MPLEEGLRRTIESFRAADLAGRRLLRMRSSRLARLPSGGGRARRIAFRLVRLRLDPPDPGEGPLGDLGAPRPTPGRHLRLLHLREPRGPTAFQVEPGLLAALHLLLGLAALVRRRPLRGDDRPPGPDRRSAATHPGARGAAPPARRRGSPGPWRSGGRSCRSTTTPSTRSTSSRCSRELLATVLIALQLDRAPHARDGIRGAARLDALLVRNEIAIALVVWTVPWIAYEVRAHRAGLSERSPRTPAPRRSPSRPCDRAVIVAPALSAYPDERISLHSYRTGRRPASARLRGRLPAAARRLPREPVPGCAPLDRERHFGIRPPRWMARRRQPAAPSRAISSGTPQLFPYGPATACSSTGSPPGPDRNPDYVPVHTHVDRRLVGLIAPDRVRRRRH